MAEVTKVRLYNHDNPVNGHEHVQVTEGGPDEEYWRALGYAPEAQESNPPDFENASGAEAGEAEEWPLQSDPADYIDSKTDDDGEPLPNLSEGVLERLALARRIVEANEE